MNIKQEVEITDLDKEELARLIEEGMTSGRLDSETEDGGTKHISWELKMTSWED